MFVETYTSPCGEEVEGEEVANDLARGVGFYINATTNMGYTLPHV